MTNNLTPQRQAARAEFAAFDRADAEQERKETSVAERRKNFHKAFYHDVPHWLEDLLDSVIESMVDMGYRSEAEDGYSIDPYSDSCRDHFFLELVLRLTQDVPFATTAEFFATAISEASAPDIVAPADMPDAVTQKRYDALEKALWAFCKTQRAAKEAKAACPIQRCTKSPAMVPGFLLR